MSNIYDLVVIGAGPSGIACAIEAKLNGLQKVVLLEKADQNNQTIRKFYKEGKRVDKEYKGQDSTTRGKIDFFDGTRESTLEYFDKLLNEHQVEVVYGCDVECVKKDTDGFEVITPKGNYKTNNAVVSIGKMGKPNKPDYKIPLPLNAVVNYNLNNVKAGEKVLIVGGGNSAVEYAIDLAGKNEVTLAYRRDTFARVNDINLENLAKCEAEATVKVRLNHDIQSVEDEGGKVKINYKDGKSRLYDRVVYAIGGSSPVDFLQKCGVEVDEKSNAVVNDVCESNVSGLYVSGDLIKTGGSIVVGINHAYEIVKDIIKKRG